MDNCANIFENSQWLAAYAQHVQIKFHSLHWRAECAELPSVYGYVVYLLEVLQFMFITFILVERILAN